MLNLNQVLGNHVQQRREALGLSRHAVAITMGHSPEWLRYLEMGRGTPQLRDVVRLAMILGCTSDELLCVKCGAIDPYSDLRDGAEAEQAADAAEADAGSTEGAPGADSAAEGP
ncbi:helix-turn-helix transcriptional regulator [Nocardioides dubius]|uniref:HTH cro/C1-type domain-containing protein n=1 Tax=Nocardioides dubius TaxID=317019 RepID=A0ABN1U2N7_9ACTN